MLIWLVAIPYLRCCDKIDIKPLENDLDNIRDFAEGCSFLSRKHYSRKQMVEIKNINLSDQQAWDSYVQAHDGGGVYFSSAWQQAVENSYGHPMFNLAAYSKQGLVGVLPLALIRKPWGRGNLVSLPFCDYGGLLADSGAVAEALLERALHLADELDAGLEIRMAQAEAVIERTGQFCQVTNKCRMVLDLPGSADQLWNSFKSKLRSQINRGGKAGLVSRRGGAELLDDFYQVFARNMRDLGSPVHSQKWMGAIIAGYGKRATVAVVYKDTLPVAAGITLSHGDSVTIPWASTLREFNTLSPNMLLYWTFLEYAADNGFSRFDFGRSTPEEGTYVFKKQWGAQPRPLYWYKREDALTFTKQVTSGGCRMVAENIWQHLPLPIANYCGPRLRKYIDR